MSSGDSTVRLNTLNSPAVSASVSGRSLTASFEFGFGNTDRTIRLRKRVDAGLTPCAVHDGLDLARWIVHSSTGIVDYSTERVFQGFDNDYPSTRRAAGQGQHLQRATDRTR